MLHLIYEFTRQENVAKIDVLMLKLGGEKSKKKEKKGNSVAPGHAPLRGCTSCALNVSEAVSWILQLKAANKKITQSAIPAVLSSFLFYLFNQNTPKSP